MNIKKSIALFDIDKTIYKDYSVFSLATYLIGKELLGVVTDVKMAGVYGEYKLGRLSYSETATELVQIFASSLEGFSYGDVKNRTSEFFMENKDRFYGYFEHLLPELKKTHEIFLVTAGPQFVAEAVEEMFGLNGYLSTQFEVVGGNFTGKVISSLAEGKGVVSELLSKYEDKTMAFGDSENDIGMLEKVVLPVCINPTEKLLEKATENNWLVVSDETAYEKVIEILT